MKRQNSRGFTLIEMAIVLGVVAVVMGGVWVVVVKVQETARIRQTVTQVVTLNKNVRSYYQTQACINTGDQTPTLVGIVGQQIFPREMVNGNAARDLWNGAVQVQGPPAGCGFLFTVDFLALPPATCVALVSQLTAPGEASRGLRDLIINGVSTNTTLNTLSPNPAVLAGTGNGQCAQNATADVALTYALRLEE